MAENLLVPLFGIQCDWEDALGTPSGGKAWVNYRNYGQEKSITEELKRAGADAETKSSGDIVVVKGKSGRSFLTVKDTKTEHECLFVASASSLSGIHKTGVISMDVAEGGLGVSVCKNNELKIWETSNGSVRRHLEGHPIDVYVCRFFPSGIVALSGGTDCCLKIWSAETGECPVTLKGHTKAVMDTCVVDRGRNVISVSKDGTARLWDCGQSKCLGTVFSCNSFINTCVLMSPTKFDLGTPIADMSDREIMTTGKLLILGREDCKVSGVSVSARKEMFTIAVPSPVNRVVAVGLNAFAAGCQGGEIVVVQLSNLDQPHIIVSATKSPILDLMSHPHSSSPKAELASIWASKADGTCVLINPNVHPVTKVVQLTGPDCDPVYQMKHDLDFIYTSCRDGLIRKYSLKIINQYCI